MEEYKVLITTSGVGSRLGDLTKNTNKCLVRITEKPSISHIIELYDKKTEFVITLGYFGDYVKQYLELTYPDLNFTFIEIDKYTGDDSSLAYTIFKCKDALQCPFIYHASDTVLDNYQVLPPKFNWILGSDHKNSSHYASCLVDDKNNVLKFNEKGEINYDFLYTGVSGIKDYKTYFRLLEQLLIDHQSKELSDVHVMKEMIKENIEFNCLEIDPQKWFDIGNSDALSSARSFFNTEIEVLDKQEESIFMFDDFVIKFFVDPHINSNRVERANILGNHVVPSIMGHSKNFYKYRKVEGNLLSRVITRGVFLELLKWSKNNLWNSVDATLDIKDMCTSFYKEKTWKRISDYLKNREDKEQIINGLLVPDIYTLLESINYDWLCNGIASGFHGDFILDNIIKTKDGFKLIDWRQDFGGNLYHGDIYYDLAKLNHNLTVNHDIINKGLYSHVPSDVNILVNTKHIECKEILHDFILSNGYDLKKVEFLTSIIWLNMAPLHEYPFNDFLFNFGKYNLYKLIKKYENNS